MSQQNGAPSFAVIGGREIDRVLRDSHPTVLELVRSAYQAHSTGQSVNPPSYFLSFPDRPTARIIALPASLGAEFQVDGIKWVSSFPANIEQGLPRASAVLILNDQRTGYPFACLESSIINATRTASFAVLAADGLSRHRARPTRIGFLGTGLIARYVQEHFVGNGWQFTETAVYDAVDDYAQAFARRAGQSASAGRVEIRDSAEALIRGSDLVVFGTTAGTPHIHDPDWFAHHPIVLHLSLRDLAPEVLLGAVNLVDDVEHCLKAQTSPHLVEQLTGSREFLAGTLHDVLTGQVTPGPDDLVIFSPFGLGVLDLAVGGYVYNQLALAGELTQVEGFFHDLDRYGATTSR